MDKKNGKKGEETEGDNLVHNWQEQTSSRISMKNYYIIGAVIIIIGIGSGLFFAKQKSSLGGLTQIQNSDSGSKKMVGSSDTSTFKDMAEGTVQKGGIDGEGTHKLIRPGGDSQTVYMTSSILDLSEFVGKKVRVWGQTYAAAKAGWLMDIGRVEAL